QDVEDNHDWHEACCDPPNRLDATDEHVHDGHGEDEAGNPNGNIPTPLHVGSDRIALGHVADTEACDDRKDGADERKDCAERSFNPACEVVRRASSCVAGGVSATDAYTKIRFSVV